MQGAGGQRAIGSRLAAQPLRCAHAYTPKAVTATGRAAQALHPAAEATQQLPIVLLEQLQGGRPAAGDAQSAEKLQQPCVPAQKHSKVANMSAGRACCPHGAPAGCSGLPCWTATGQKLATVCQRLTSCTGAEPSCSCCMRQPCALPLPGWAV